MGDRPRCGHGLAQRPSASRSNCLQCLLPHAQIGELQPARGMSPSMKKRTPGTAAAIFLASGLLAGCSGNDPEKALASAKDYLKKDDTKSATIQIKNALQIDPDLGEARFLL